MTKISIIVPLKNAEKTIKNCIENLQKQKYKNIELLLIDDSSTDLSKQIIEPYLTNKKIKYFYLKDTTEGVGKARNYGIKKANGKYIMFVDSDDLIEEKLLINLEKYINQDIDIIKYKIKNIEGPIFETTKGEDGFNKLCFKDRLIDSPCIYLIKKELFERTGLKFEENIYHEDFGLIPQLIINAKTIVSTKEEGYIYIQTENSIMRNKDYKKTLKKVQDKIMLYDCMINNLERFNISNQTKENLKRYYTNSIIDSLGTIKKKDRKEFIKMISERKMFENMKPKNLKQYCKNIIIKQNINLYFKMKGTIDAKS